MAGNSAEWLRVRTPRPHARCTLVCLPHAGGAASFFRDWGSGLPAEVEVQTVQYPGRENRLGTAPLLSMADLADAVAEAIEPLFARPVVLFGHSMGASLMYETTRRLEAAGREPALLIASGHAAPHRREPKALHLGSDDDLVAELRRYETGPSALDDPDLREMLLPAIRADYQVIETYRPSSPVPVRAPLAVFRGAVDEDVTEDQANGWADLTAAGPLRAHRVFPGGHFYLREHPGEVLAAVSAEIATAYRSCQPV
ncbi:thioesterase II family protein [Amycolatopsis benzoatilytica]|uniref:thioesterase II family protein n=1 Tax=Amycolatopsis benzoatilytica TaxID=346045 RepID=UPI000484FE9B|nr:alpha/beta fold hydrolase [Amycolatopsis benzoatilytica]